MPILSFLLQKSKRTVILAVVAGLISGVCSASLIAYINQALADTSSTTPLLWYFIALCLLVFATKAVSQVLLTHLAQNAFFDLRMYLSSQVLSSPLRHLEKIGPARLLATLTDDIALITNSIVGIPYLFINLAVVIGCLGYLAILSPFVFLIVIVVLVVGVYTYQLPVNKAQHYLSLSREDQDKMFRHFEALTRGIKELKLHLSRQKAFFTDDLRQTADEYRQHSISGMVIYSIAGSWGQLLYFVLIGVVLFAVPELISVEQAVLTGYVLIVLYMMSPIEVVMGWAPQIGRANVAFKKIESLGLLLTEDKGEVPPTNLTPAPAWQKIEMTNVIHTYYREQENHNFTLGPIDLQLFPGELLFIIGGNGSGKSTLVKVLAGLYPPETGQIALDETSICDANRVWYRQYFTAVFSDFYLFDKLLGLDTPELNHQAYEYVRQLQLDHKVEINDGIFSTTELSRGQQKRLALLTAYLEDRPIYIFDEWAADQDPYFKEIFYTQLLPDLKRREKSVLVVTHDDRYFHLADRIVKLDDGQVATHHEYTTHAPIPKG